jgi:HlyD family secretion protein
MNSLIMNKISQILGLAGIVTAMSCSAPETIQPETKSVMEAVYASGFLESVGQIELRSQAEGILGLKAKRWKKDKYCLPSPD